MLALLDPSPDSSSCPGQLLRAYFRSKRAKREVYELDPPLLGPQPRILGRPGTLDLNLSLYRKIILDFTPFVVAVLWRWQWAEKAIVQDGV